MKKFIMISFLIATVVSIFAQNNYFVLDREHNMSRDKDKQTRKLLPFIKSDQRGDGQLWDFSLINISNNDAIITRYQALNDSVNAIIENRQNEMHHSKGDSIYLHRQASPGKLLDYPLPELIMKYPFSFRDSIGGFFYGEGFLNVNQYYRNAGFSSTAVIARGGLITPDLDSLSNVMLVKCIRQSSILVRNTTGKTFYSTNDSLCFSPDSIRRALSSDSITNSVETWRWYARGYRYPVIESKRYIVYNHGVPIDSSNIALYFSPKIQQYELEDDIKNELVRYEDQNSSFRVTLPNNPHSRYKSVNNNNNSNKNDNGSINNLLDNMTENGNSCSVSPLKVYRHTTVSYLSSQSEPVRVEVFSVNGGKVLEITEDTSSDGQINCNLANLNAGGYLMVVSVGADIFSYKILKVD